jgi:hypothetical protein
MEEPKYKKIIKYINYQKINVNINKFNDINALKNNEKTNLNNISFNELKRIKKLNRIFKDIPTSEYYIFILESLPDYILRNVYRSFSYKWNRYRNESKINKSKLKYNIDNIYQNSNIKDLLLDELENLPESINYFINSINDFFISN